jgi:acyl carrier protein
MDDAPFLMLHRLRSTIASGAIASTDRLDDCGGTLDKVFGIDDSLDRVELVMGLEEKYKTKINTVDDLMRALEKLTSDPAIPLS